MFLLQEPTPDTSAYLIAGYVLAFSVMAIYVASLVIRRRNLQRDLQALTALQSEKKTPPPAPRPRRSATAKKKAAVRRAARKK